MSAARERKLTASDAGRLLSYVGREPEYNIFIIGDAENFGFDSPDVEFFGFETAGGSFDSVALRFFSNWVVYAEREDYDAAALARFLQERGFYAVTGKGATLRALKRELPGSTLRYEHLSVCGQMMEQQPLEEGLTLRRMSASQATALTALFGEIEEFKELYEGDQLKIRTEEKRAEIARGSEICYGVFDGNELVSTAAVAADCSAGGMVVGVATRRDMRGRGLASAAVSAVCRDRYGAGRRTLTIFYDNPAAARIYERLGFRRVGEYGMLRPPQADGKAE